MVGPPGCSPGLIEHVGSNPTFLTERVQVSDSEMYGVYTITSPNGSVYVGMTTKSFSSRWKSHKKELRSSIHKCKGLLRAYDKYGIEGLEFKVLEDLSGCSDSYVLGREKFWWNSLKKSGINLYNGEPTGTGSVNHSESTKNQIGKSVLNNMKDLVCSRSDCSITFKGIYRKYCSRKCKYMDSERICEKCGEKFTGLSRRTNICSVCLPVIARRISNKAVAERICTVCGGEYTSNNKKYCSQKCRTMEIDRLDSVKIKEMYLDGVSLRNIANEAKISHMTVKKVLVTSGVKLRGH